MNDSARMVASPLSPSPVVYLNRYFEITYQPRWPTPCRPAVRIDRSGTRTAPDKAGIEVRAARAATTSAGKPAHSSASRYSRNSPTNRGPSNTDQPRLDSTIRRSDELTTRASMGDIVRETNYTLLVRRQSIRARRTNYESSSIIASAISTISRFFTVGQYSRRT